MTHASTTWIKVEVVDFFFFFYKLHWLLWFLCPNSCLLIFVLPTQHGFKCLLQTFPDVVIKSDCLLVFFAMWCSCCSSAFFVFGSLLLSAGYSAQVPVFEKDDRSCQWETPETIIQRVPLVCKPKRRNKLFNPFFWWRCLISPHSVARAQKSALSLTQSGEWLTEQMNH